MKPTAAVLVLALATATFGAQTPKRQKAILNEPAATAAPAFVCPDSEAKPSCTSYTELVRAKDKGLKATGDDRFVCFKKNKDEFFVIVFPPPQLPLTYNEKFKKMMVEPSATSVGAGYSTTFKDGVENEQIMPSFFFSGKWREIFGPSFSADSFGIEETDTTHNGSTLTINESQFSATYKYKNLKNEDVIYSLTIQRSTGRFTESYQQTSEQFPSAQDTGRCIYQKAQ